MIFLKASNPTILALQELRVRMCFSHTVLNFDLTDTEPKVKCVFYSPPVLKTTLKAVPADLLVMQPVRDFRVLRML